MSPIYVYKCTACNELIEIIQRISDPTLTKCELCNTLDSLEKQIVQTSKPKFKGTGFYETDYKKNR